MEGYVAAEYIWHLRLLVGILEKVHLEGERGPTYQSTRMKNIMHFWRNLTKNTHHISLCQQDFQKWKVEEEKQHYGALEKRQKEEVESLLLGKRKLEEIIAEQERHINRLQKSIEEQDKSIQTYKQELNTLFAYVNSMHTSSEESSEDACDDDMEMLKGWAEKKVLVIGGHIHWHFRSFYLLQGCFGYGQEPKAFVCA